MCCSVTCQAVGEQLSPGGRQEWTLCWPSKVRGAGEGAGAGAAAGAAVAAAAAAAAAGSALGLIS